MANYRMEDGTVVRTENASQHYEEESDFDGHNMIGRSSRSQWHDQALYRSRKGRYYIEHRSRVSGERDWAEWVSPEQAVAWLALNDRPLPPELAEAAEHSVE